MVLNVFGSNNKIFAYQFNKSQFVKQLDKLEIGGEML